MRDPQLLPLAVGTASECCIYEDDDEGIDSPMIHVFAHVFMHIIHI